MRWGTSGVHTAYKQTHCMLKTAGCGKCKRRPAHRRPAVIQEGNQLVQLVHVCSCSNRLTGCKTGRGGAGGGSE